MSSFEPMPKDPNKITVQAHLTKEEYKAYSEVTAEKQWSDKRLNENIIRWYLSFVKTGKMPEDAYTKKQRK